MEGQSFPNVENNKVHEEAKRTENKPTNVKVDTKKINEKELEDFLAG